MVEKTKRRRRKRGTRKIAIAIVVLLFIVGILFFGLSGLKWIATSTIAFLNKHIIIVLAVVLVCCLIAIIAVAKAMKEDSWDEDLKDEWFD